MFYFTEISWLARLSIVAAASSLLVALPSWAQVATSDPNRVAESAIEPVLVTAQKRGIPENVETVPVTLSAFGVRDLGELHVRNLQDLTTAAPNVVLSDSGVIPSFANFTIRGLGTNSTIPSVEPAVGVFVDGVYLGMLAGAVLNLFDIEDIEILRGPQGTLFGRNTTGGAVLVNTRRPGDRFAVNGRATIETGLEETVSLSIEAPLTPTFRAKIATFYDNDAGWFKNQFDGRSFGARHTASVRPTLMWIPSANFDSTLIYESGATRGHGAVAQNPAFFDGFTVDIDNPGYNKLDQESATLESNWRLPNGVITNIFGFRSLDQSASDDVDAQPISLFHAFDVLHQHQFSDELRGSAQLWDRVDVTAGFYYFTQSFSYFERRVLAGGAIDSTFGGQMDVANYAAFAETETHITPEVGFIAGGRFTSETKTAHVATFVPMTAGSRCNLVSESCDFDFPGPAFAGAPGRERWDSFLPKLGFRWQAATNVLLYGGWTRGVRSGGYNVRNTSFTIAPGPYGPESQDAFELGLKSALLDQHFRIQTAVFRNTIKGMQSDINFPDPVAGIVQVTKNAANATIQGGETEFVAVLADGLVLTGNVGYLDGHYTSVLFDLDGGGIGASDLALNLPRLSKWSYSIGGSYTFDISGAYSVQLRMDYGYRSRAVYTDSNATYLAPIRNLTSAASLTLPASHWTLSIYGRNLLNTVTDGVVAPLPPALGGGAFRTLNEGRVIGAEARFTY